MNTKIKEVIKENKEKIFVIFFTLLYAIITAIIAIHHENWRDENQVWLLCKNLSFIDLIKQLKYEGHPIMWFAVVYPFVKLGFSCKILNFLCWILMTISVYIILKKAPLGKLPRICIVLTFPFMYQYVIVARSYALIVLLVILICVLDKKKKQHPVLYGVILALLANTHLIMVGLVGMITITYYIYELTLNRKNNTKEENLKILKGFLVVLAGGVILLIQLLGVLTVETEIKMKLTISELFENISYSLTQYAYALLYSDEYNNIVNLIFIIFALVGTVFYKKETIVFLGSILFQCIIYAILGGPALYMSMSIILILMYTMWSSANEITKNKENIKIIVMFEVMIIIISLLSLKSIKSLYINEYKYKYSSAKDIGTYIYENLDDKIFITSKDAHCSSMIPYTKNAKFWNINTQDYFTYITWDYRREKLISEDDIENVIKENFLDDENIYYITCSGREDEVEDYLKEKGKLEIIYETDESLMDESYILYKIKLK